jgi:tetratricopeptide (TPR) repeat protein
VYTEALQLARGDALIYSNRALVRLQLNAYELACQDCDAALALDPSLAKVLALSR